MINFKESEKQCSILWTKRWIAEINDVLVGSIILTKEGDYKVYAQEPDWYLDKETGKSFRNTDYGNTIDLKYNLSSLEEAKNWLCKRLKDVEPWW